MNIITGSIIVEAKRPTGWEPVDPDDPWNTDTCPTCHHPTDVLADVNESGPQCLDCLIDWLTHHPLIEEQPPRPLSHVVPPTPTASNGTRTPTLALTFEERSR